MKNKIIVTLRLSDGDSLSVSAKANDRAISRTEVDKLLRDLNKKFIKYEKDILYFTVRSDLFGEKNNWKYYTHQEVEDCVKALI